MQLEQFRPIPRLVAPATTVDRPRFPVIDAHNHLGEQFGHNWIARPLPEMLDALDAAGVTHLVDLDGGWGEHILQQHLEKLAPSGRFLVFGGVDWARWPELGDAFPEYAARRLEAQKAWGAAGLKVWKPFGLSVVDQHGALAHVDDPRLDPLWQAAGELGLPVTIHVADPVAFFDPLDETNERWEELSAHPDWQFPSPPFPPFLSIVEGLAALVQRHPRTTFIGAHVGCYAEDLDWVSAVLQRCPNFYVDISARLGELGRRPYRARRFFLEHAERILFGIDMGIELPAYRVAYRFLETADEYFNYDINEIPGQGRWYVYGLHLPDDVLQRVYSANARRILSLPEENPPS
ncbi:MAG: amidohydrolase family protein [Chloroflexota bacterium]